MQNVNQDKSKLSRNDSRGRVKVRGRNTISVRCYTCQRLGHIAKFCQRKDDDGKPDKEKY